MMNMKKKIHRHRERGSVTVLLTLILIPTIILSGFLTDLARIKLYSNQALVTADNYGEAVLTQYDNVLKELYGFFAVTQNGDGMAAIETLQDYMKTSFDPTVKTVDFKHLQGTFLNKGNAPDGFMPYRSADLKLEWEAADDNANLANEDVFATQLGDFMRYRIVEESADWILDIADQAKHMKADISVVNEKAKLDEVAGDVMEAQKAYYQQLAKMCSYYDYLKDLNITYQKIFFGTTDKKDEGIDELYYFSHTNHGNIENQERYEQYIEAAEAALTEEEVEESDSDEDEDTSEERESLDLEAEGSYFESETDREINLFQNVYFNGQPHGKYQVTFSNYDSEAQKLDRLADEYADAVAATKAQKQKMDQSLASDNVSDSLKGSMTTELENQYNDLLDPQTENDYKNIAGIFLNDIKNSSAQSDAKNMNDSLEKLQKYYLRYYFNLQDSLTEMPETADDIPISEYYKDFKKNTSYKEIYEKLEQAYGSSKGVSESDLEQQADAKKKEATDAVDNIKKDLDTEEENTSARNIPDSVGIGKDGTAVLFSFEGIIGAAKELMDSSGFAEIGNDMLLKLYTTTYDFGMFSSRVTDVKKEKEGEQTSLTDYPIADNINYLYGAELEYLFGGMKNSNENLKQTRNQILTVRVAMNMVSSFTIPEVNSAITEISTAFMEIPPLGIAVNAALRLGFSAIETYGDWDQLKKGESVPLMKMQISELSSIDLLTDLFPDLANSKNQTAEETKNPDVESKNKIELDKSKNNVNIKDNAPDGKKGTKVTLELNYEQYMVALLLLFTSGTDILKRTGDLVCLNVNHVVQESEFTSLQFRMDKATTAVKASCSVHLDYAVMPDGVLKSFVEGDTYNSMKEFEKHYYKYSIVRGY